MKKLVLSGLLMATVLLLALAASPVIGGNHGSDIEKGKRAQEKVNQKVLPNKDVVGTAVGRNAEGEVVVRVFTAKSGVGGIPKEQDGVKVLVKVTGPIVAIDRVSAPALAPSTLATTARWPRPVPIGVSTGHPDITAGTIGARVTNGTNIYALSNNHVYADENSASIGDNVLQPGTFDGGVNPDDAIGTLSDFEPLKFNNFGQCLNKGKRCNKIDAAIAVSSTLNLDKATPSGGYGTPKSTTVSASLDQQVQKFGRTTSLTKGKITGINAMVNVGYSSGSALFVDQIIVEDTSAFIQGGDSGSLLVTDDAGLNPVGLLFAGNSDGTFAVANRIDLVLANFGVTVDDSDGGDPADTPTPEPPTPTPTPAPTATPVPPGSDIMFVWDIDMFHKTKGRGELINTVTIHEDTDNPLSGATVSATLSREGNSWNFVGKTNDSGKVTFKLKFPWSNTEYTLCVTSVTHSHTYDALLNVETCDSLTTS